MGSTWIDKALNGVKKMTGNLNDGKAWFRLAGLCAVVFLSTCLLNVMSQVIDTSGPDRAYCVGTGNLYATTPGVNNANSQTTAGVTPMPSLRETVQAIPDSTRHSADWISLMQPRHARQMVAE
jgi:hypothetical protein